MKINEVEALAGISKKNIRFYEEQGLLCPRRNADNGYRDYSDADVQILRRIRLLRKLGVPIEEIRQMLSGIHTVGDGMRRHMITMEREKRNLEQSMELCRQLQNQQISLNALDADEILRQMEEMEKSGTSFRDGQEQDIRRQYTAPIIVTVLAVVFFAAIISVLIWGFREDPGNAPPIWLLYLLIAIFAAMGIGAMLALLQRIREIGKGELNDAKYY